MALSEGVSRSPYLVPTLVPTTLTANAEMPAPVRCKREPGAAPAVASRSRRKPVVAKRRLVLFHKGTSAFSKAVMRPTHYFTIVKLSCFGVE